jgi:polar amino acid transport system permease protein
MSGFASGAILIEQLVKGAAVTLEVTVVAAAVALALSFAIGLARLSRSRLIRFVATIYVEIIRGTSALVQLFYLFFILPLFGVSIDPFTTAVLGLGINFSAYGSEVVRAAVVAINRGQWDAARALDMPKRLAMRRIILPQALASMLPPFGNMLVELLKSTSLVSLITLTDLTFAGSRLIVSSGRPGIIWAAVLCFYFVMAFPLSQAVRHLERRIALYRGS